MKKKTEFQALLEKSFPEPKKVSLIKSSERYKISVIGWDGRKDIMTERNYLILIDSQQDYE